MGCWKRVLVRVLDSALPAGDVLPGIDPDRCAEMLDRIRREAPLILRLSLHASVAVFLASPLLTVGRPCPALWLSPARLDSHADRMARHRWYLMRQSMLMIKTVAGLCWGADPAVRGALGMEPYAPDSEGWREA